MSHQAIESIWHFIGQFHIAELLNLSSRSYLGAPKLAVAPYEGTDQAKPKTYADPAVERPVALDPIDPSVVTGAATSRINEAASALHVELPPPPPVVLQPALTQPRLDVPADPIGEGGAVIDAVYTIGQTQALDIAIRQLNLLDDRDAVLDGSATAREIAALAGEQLDHAARATAFDQADAVEGFVPASIAELLGGGDLAGVEHQRTELDGGVARPLPDLRHASGTDDAIVTIETGNGRFVNGARVSEDGQTAGGQNDDIATWLDRIEPDSEDSLLLDMFAESVSDATPGDAAATTTFPQGAGTLEIATGDDTQTNVAILNDIHGAAASRVIYGDYYETNAIVQVNVYAAIGQAGPGMAGTGALLAMLSGGAMADAGGDIPFLTNDASFLREAGTLFGTPGMGGPGTTDWRIDYIEGDYYDVSVIEQTNLANDSDAAAATVGQGQYIATLGDNDQLNLTQLADLGNDYELIIVGGDWHAINAILQVNLLVDDAGPGGSNSLLNDAAIVGIGGRSSAPLTGNALALGDAIAAQETGFDYALAIGLPGNGDGVFDVLYVSGDYVTANLVLQTNVLVDADVALIEGAGDAATGGNDLVNAALINDIDSVSAYQFLGGETFEESILIQAEIIVDEDGSYVESGAGPIHPDVIASIAAMSGIDDDGPADQAGTSSSSAVASVDVLGGFVT